MLLTIDIGNSSTKFGLFDRSALIERLVFPTDRSHSADNIFSLAGGKLPGKLDGVIVSSVVKELQNAYTDFGDRYFGLETIFVDHTSDFGFSIKYFPPEDCGADRLVDAYAAAEKYGLPVIVCDFGTATTIDVVNERHEYLGGIITPGPDTLGSALFEKTSKLPEVEFGKPGSVIGNSTISSIQSGIYFGYIGLVDGIIKRIIREVRKTPTVVSTGGFAASIAKESRYIEIVEENLMLEGLRMLFENRETKN